MEEYELDELYGTEEFEKCIFEVKQLKKRFEQVHVKLKRVLEDNEHDRLYENYENDVKRMTDWIKGARREVSKRKKEEFVEKEREENEDKAGEKEELTRNVIVEKEELARKQREEVKVEEKYFKLRVDQYLYNLDD